MSAAERIRKTLTNTFNSSEITDGQWVAIGLLAVAESIDRVSDSIDGLAARAESGLGDVEAGLARIAEEMPAD